MILLKSIPKVDKFIKDESFVNYSRKLISKIAKDVIGELRDNILSNRVTDIDEKSLINECIKRYEELLNPSLKNLINATGIIVHTNLGRSLIDEESFEKVKKIVSSYNNLEYDLKVGKRGERYAHIVKSLKALTGCEDAIVVNNNASAVFLILNTFAKNQEVIVSRGELVEIGGSFRVPEVMAQSGALLKEVGATNKTHLRDYTENINENTAMLMKVHKSNYTIEGFSSEVCFEDIVKVSQENKLIDYYDMGSGHMIDLPYGLDKVEPSILKIMEYSPSLVSFSGDKLLGSVQAGVIVGKKELIDKIKKNHLLRMLRVDKLTLALLQESLNAYLKDEIEKIPTIAMLHTDVKVLEKRAKELQSSLKNVCKCEVIESQTLIGGGTTPNKKIPTVALGIEYKDFKPNKIEKLLRKENLITRIENEKVLIDLRSVRECELQEIQKIVLGVFGE
ncbi:MAG: L-seryl-tRNA(Sec) selenium transferase [Sphaerochaetaceae bacterium]|nr:L-seryl-tRNA(Sec) selenium transferase [Sphaerochaetaceae bacterium]